MIPNHVTWTLELFLVGLEDNGNLFSNDKLDSEINALHWDDSNLFTGFNWLTQLAKKGQRSLPNAILINSALLEDDKNHLFIASLKKSPVLGDIPIIAITPEGVNQPDCHSLIKLGIDDHYEVPIIEERLEKRIDFLNDFKSKYSKDLEQNNDAAEYKIPLDKRVFDIIIASCIILAISPILLLVAAAIAIESRGGIVYRSKRVGTGYQIFDFLKFRSMYPDADKRLAEIQHLNRYNENGGENTSGVAFMKFKNDPRITKVGKFIRKTSIDELPQLFNVLRGEMSIVGNRPLPLYEAEQLTKDQWAERFLAPAGITGLWQVSPEGKDTMSVEQRIGLDIEYAKNFSLAKDIQILAKTPFAMIQKGE